MVFDATFNNISVISWQSVLLMEETGGPGENHRPVASHWQTYFRCLDFMIYCEMFFSSRHDVQQEIVSVYSFYMLSFYDIFW